MRTLSTVLCTSGLAAEAKVARRAGFRVVVGAGDYDRTVTVLDTAISHARCLISFGIAGALQPGLRAGSVVVSGDVVGDDRRWTVDDEFSWAIAELARRVGAVQGPVYGARRILSKEEEKASAHRQTGALAVDTESAIVAAAAESAGIPFVVLRAIADPATRELPPAALIPLSEEGTPVLAEVMASVWRRPSQIPALVGLARETRQALNALIVPARALHGLLAAA